MAIQVTPGEPGSGVVVPLALPTLWARDMGKPLPPIRWVSQGLTVAPGRPTVLAGQGGARKGWLAMGLMIHGALEVPMLGFDVRRIRSVYLDYEQTERATSDRFQLLAGGLQVRLESLDDRFGYRWRPVPSWAPREANTSRVIDQVSRHLDGFDLAVVDSVRACSGGVDENSNLASVPFDVATAASEKTGCAVMFIDHASGKAAEGQRRVDAQRGHSSKKDACQTLIVLTASKGQPTKVTCERSQLVPEDKWFGDFGFTLASTAGGLTLVRAETEECKPDLLRGQVVTWIEANPGCSGNQVAEGVPAHRNRVLAMISSLLSEKVVVRESGKLYVPSDDGELPL